MLRSFSTLMFILRIVLADVTRNSSTAAYYSITETPANKSPCWGSNTSGNRSFGTPNVANNSDVGTFNDTTELNPGLPGYFDRANRCFALRDTKSSPLVKEYLYVLELYVNPSLAIWGMISNIICVIILCRKDMRNAYNTYLCALALSDILYELSTVLYCVPLAIQKYDYSMGTYFYAHAYKYKTFLELLPFRYSTCLIFTLSVHRTVAVLTPLRVKYFFLEKRPALTSIIVFAVLLCLISPFGLLFTVVPKTNETLNITGYGNALSEIGKHVFFPYYTLVLNILLKLFPSLGIFISGICIIAALRRAAVKRQAMGIANLGGSAGTNGGYKDQVRISSMLLLMAVLFLLSIIPSTIVTIQGFIKRQPRHAIHEYYTVGNLLYLLQAAVNLIIYTKFSARFRRNICILLRRSPDALYIAK